MAGPALYSASHYLIAVIFYAFHFPECMFPGWFDWAGSHAIWHLLIIRSESSAYFSIYLFINLLSLTPRLSHKQPSPFAYYSGAR